MSVCQTFPPVTCSCQVRQRRKTKIGLAHGCLCDCDRHSGLCHGSQARASRQSTSVRVRVVSCFVYVCMTCRRLARLFKFGQVEFEAHVSRLGFSWASADVLTLWAVSTTIRGTLPTRCGVCVSCPCARPQGSVASSCTSV